MRTSNGWIVTKCSYPGFKDRRRQWRGQWFKFWMPSRDCFCYPRFHREERAVQSGAAHWSMLGSYIGREAWLEVRKHYKRIRGLK